MKYKRFESEFLNQNSKALIFLGNSIYLLQSLWKALSDISIRNRAVYKFLKLPYSILENGGLISN